jgi:hypothetical protein
MPKFDQNLLPGEAVIFRTQYHWTNIKGFFVWATLACGVGVSLLGAWWYTPVDQRTYSPMPGAVVLGIGILLGVIAQVSVATNQFTVTNQRIRFRAPWRSYDVFLDQVQEIAFRKSPLADYGTLLFTIGGTMEKFDNVQRVEQFAAIIEQQMSLLRRGTAAVPAQSRPS